MNEPTDRTKAQRAVDEKLYGTTLLGEPIRRPTSGPLAERFGFPPFSVLDARQGSWQKRKRAWVGLGIRSEVGRTGLGDTCITPVAYFGKGETFAGDSGSIFDPVLCESIYRWFCPEGGQVVDPFAGGSVRGIVAGLLGHRYWGCDLRQEQIDANEDQADAIIGQRTYGPEDLTPVQRTEQVWLKRDDLCVVHNNARGGKARTCWALSQDATHGLVTAGSRQSPQAALVAAMAKALNLHCRIHVPCGDISEGPVAEAALLGADIIQHKAGYNTVIMKRAHDDATVSGWTLIPFGMECQEAVTQTRQQVKNIPSSITRIVVPVGSGMTLAGILWGLVDLGRTDVQVLGVVVGANPEGRLNRYAPPMWQQMVRLVSANEVYETHVNAQVGDVALDPVYEAKCKVFLQEDDLFWLVGHRAPLVDTVHNTRPVWVCGDAQGALDIAPRADLIFSCPPYGDLEQYSDDPRDLSNMEWREFEAAYKHIIRQAVGRLKPNRFACFVVGDFRDAQGFYRDFVSRTIADFRSAGAELYNEAVLVTPAGTAALRGTRQFEAGRKFVKTHQNVLVFCKGDWRKAVTACTKHKTP